MDTLQSMQVFRTVVTENSFTKAAEILDISIAMASKHVRHLEKHIQAKLLNRNSRHLSLTEIGQHYYLQCCHALDTLEQAKVIAQQKTITPQGVLKIAAPVWFATPYFAQILARFQQRYPKVILSIHLQNRFTDLIAEGFDLAIRATDHLADNMIARPLGNIQFSWVATQKYLEQHHIPKNLTELEQHRILKPSYTELNIKTQAVAETDNTLLIYQMMLSDMGIAYLPEWLTLADIEKQVVKRLVIDHKKDSIKLNAVYMNREFLSQKISRFVDFIANEFKMRKFYIDSTR